MPKWLIVIVTTALAGFLGFACGSLLTRPDRQKKQSALDQAKKLTSENAALRVNIASVGIEPEEVLPPPDLPVWDMNKKQFLGFCASKGFLPSNTDNLQMTWFETENDCLFCVTWKIEGRKFYIEEIFIYRPDVEDSLTNAEPVLAIWEKILPEIVPLFIQLKKETNPYSLGSKTVRFRDTDYVYKYAPANKYVLFYKFFWER